MKRKTPACRTGRQNAFTLIESLVAITILLIGVLGPMTAATRGITDGLFAQNQLIATYLAQEVLELASIQIANNNLSGNGFLSGLNDSLNDKCLIVDGGCAVVVTAASDVSFDFVPCADANNCQMAYDQASGFYTSLGNTGPVFTRILTVESPTSKEALLKVRVTWFNKSTPKDFSLLRYEFDQAQ